MDLCLKRLKSELADMEKNPLIGCTIRPTSEKMNVWEGVIEGVSDTPYEGGKYIIELNIPEDYPMSPPEIQVRTKIYHPCID